jgi:hypothetical protein
MSATNESIPVEYVYGDWNSLYIPSIPAGLHTFSNGGTIAEPFTEERLTQMIEEYLYLGKVSRVDFVEKEGRARSAFVHFENWNKHEIVNMFRHILNTEGVIKFSSMDEWDVNNVKNEKNNLRFGLLTSQSTRDFHILFKINHTPIPAADGTQNIHQLAAANEFLENKVKELENRVKELEEGKCSSNFKIFELIQMLSVYMNLAGVEVQKQDLEKEWGMEDHLDLPETTKTPVSTHDRWTSQPGDRW